MLPIILNIEAKTGSVDVANPAQKRIVSNALVYEYEDKGHVLGAAI